MIKVRYSANSLTFDERDACLTDPAFATLGITFPLGSSSRVLKTEEPAFLAGIAPHFLAHKVEFSVSYE